MSCVRCGHPVDWHRHYRGGGDCSRCGCPGPWLLPCWLVLRRHGRGWWSAGSKHHCAVWGYANPLSALWSARQMHRSARRDLARKDGT